MTYIAKLDAAIASSKSHVVVGLDPELQKIPAIFQRFANPVLEFNKMIIHSSKDHVAGYKLNMAFYEYLEEKGLEAIRGTLAEVPEGKIKICDAKRGDIGNTSGLYAKAFFENLEFDAVTVAPYMGEDSVKPFLAYPDKWVILLALTSNAGSADFQFTPQENGQPLFTKVIEK